MTPDRPSGARRLRSITYEHEGDRYEVTVGSSREVYRRKTGPRGGYIKNADQQSWGSPTGSVITRIELGDPCHVYSEEPARGWANPSFVGRHEMTSIEYFVDSVPEGLDATDEGIAATDTKTERP